MKQNSKRRAVELGKDALILLLTCSALWLAARTQLLGPLSGLLKEEQTQSVAGQSQEEEQTSIPFPMAMAVNLPNQVSAADDQVELPDSGEGVRFGLLCDQKSSQDLFQRVAGILIETISTAQKAEKITREQWQLALCDQVGVYMDFQGEIPMSVLSLWLSGESTQLQGSVRKMALAVWEDSVALYYRNEEDGDYYRCTSTMSNPDALVGNLSSVSGNGAFYAFESEDYASLDGDTLLLPDSPAPMVYTAANPVSGGEESLAALVQDIGFILNSTNFYPTDGWVARSGDDSVRLSDRGVVEYTAGDDSGLLPVLQQGGDELYNSVETCRRVAMSVMASRSGEARLYLSAVTQVERGLQIDFGYSLNGVPVSQERGYAARFLVINGRITQFTMYLRSYTASGTTSVVMPPKQALAAFSAMGLDGQELVLVYTDSGGDTVTAGWAARDDAAGEG